ncbi:hypothetical protein ABIE50_000381 [Chitinophaga sp. OAE865]
MFFCPFQLILAEVNTQATIEEQILTIPFLI